MRRTRNTIGLYGCAVVLLALSMASFLSNKDSKRLYDGLVTLKQPLTARGIRSSFVAVWSEPHEITVTFPHPSGISDVDAFVEHATDRVGHYQDRPTLDMTWRVYDDGVVISAGSGANGASGVSLGQRSRGFSFGSFPVKAGRTYEVMVDVGPRFAPLLRASPSVEVNVATATASVGLAFSTPLGRAITRVTGALGAIVLAIALWYQRRGSGRPTTRCS
jgi:hypothetical protein